MQKRIPISENLTVLLLEPSGPPDGLDQNLLAVSGDDGPVWRATLPSRPDHFTDVELVDGVLFAWSFSCYQCQIDVETGNTRHLVFTK